MGGTGDKEYTAQLPPRWVNSGSLVPGPKVLLKMTSPAGPLLFSAVTEDSALLSVSIVPL